MKNQIIIFLTGLTVLVSVQAQTNEIKLRLTNAPVTKAQLDGHKIKVELTFPNSQIADKVTADNLAYSLTVLEPDENELQTGNDQGRPRLYISVSVISNGSGSGTIHPIYNPTTKEMFISKSFDPDDYEYIQVNNINVRK